VVEPRDETPVTLQLAADVRPTLTGRVVGNDGKPVAYALVRGDTQATHQLSAYENPWRFLMSHTVADDQGRFTLRALWPKMSQKLRIRRGGYAERQVAVDVLAPDEVRDLGDISLEVADLVITGRVVDEKGKPVPGAHVEVYRRRGMFSRSFHAGTDLEGRFRIEGLPREEVYLHADQFRFHSTHELVGPEPREVTVRVVRREDQILFEHRLKPPLQRKVGDFTATLRALYRFRAFDRGGQLNEYLGLDLEMKGPAEGPYPQPYVFDDQGRNLAEASPSARVSGRYIRGFELPEGDVRALSQIVAGQPVRDLGKRLEFSPLPLAEMVSQHGHMVFLWVLELTDEWIEPEKPEQAVTPADPPYLSARFYALCSRQSGYEPISAAGLPDGPQLLPRCSFYYDPATGEVDAPFGLDHWHEQLAKEARSVFAAAEDRFGRGLPELAIAGCWFQSAGGHGEIALPEAVTATLMPTFQPGSSTVVFENIPLPAELTQATQF